MVGKAITELRSTYPERITMRSPGTLIVFIMFNLFVSIASASYANNGGNEATSNFHEQARSPNVTVHPVWPFGNNRHRHHHNRRKSQQKQTQDIRKSLNSFKSFNNLQGRQPKYAQHNKNSLNLKFLPSTRHNETIKHHRTNSYLNQSSIRGYKETPNQISLRRTEEVAWTRNVPASHYTSNQLQQHNIRHQNHKSPRMKEDASKHYNYDSATTLATPINHQSHQSYARNRNSHSSPWRQSIPSYVHTVTTTTTTVNYDEDYEYDYLEKTPGSRINRGAEIVQESTTASLTNYKWENFGTREGVNQQRKNFRRDRQNPDYWNEQLVGDHVERVNTEAMCKIPHKKVEYMKSSPNKSYRPKWTILYRCGNDTACCSESHTCGMKNQVQLILPFKVVENAITRYENITFYNHTECHCVRLESRQTPPAPLNKVRCNCPQYFEKETDSENNCWCKCPEWPIDNNCKQLINGTKEFSMEDHRRIRNGTFGTPKCLYGSYKTAQGRCPSWEDRMNMFDPLKIKSN